MGEVFEEANLKKSILSWKLMCIVLYTELGIVFCDVFSKWMHYSFVEDSNMWKVVFKVFKVNLAKYFNHIIDFFSK